MLESLANSGSGMTIKVLPYNMKVNIPLNFDGTKTFLLKLGLYHLQMASTEKCGGYAPSNNVQLVRTPLCQLLKYLH